MVLFTPNNNEKSDYYRVTQVLSGTQSLTKRKMLRDWKIRVGFENAEKIKEKAFERGNAFHAQPEALFRNDTSVVVSPSITKFLEDKDIKILLCETNVYHDDLKYKGRLDMFYERNGKKGILDWKTSNAPRPLSYFADYKSQISAYSAGMEFQHEGLVIDEAMIVLAYPVLENPFEQEWAFQVVEMNKSSIKRSFTRFAKKVSQFNKQNGIPLPDPEHVQETPFLVGSPF